MAEKFPNLKKETKIQVQESPKQDETKEIHTKTYNNWNAKDQRQRILKAVRRVSYLQGKFH